MSGIREGARLPSVPDWQAAIAATFQQPICSGITGYLTGTWQYIGSRYTQVGDDVPGFGVVPLYRDPPPAPSSALPNTIGGPLTQHTFVFDPLLPAYNLLNLRLGTRFTDFDVAFYVNNVTDERAFLALDRERGLLARVGYLTNQPRTFGITARTTFSMSCGRARSEGAGARAVSDDVMPRDLAPHASGSVAGRDDPRGRCRASETQPGSRASASSSSEPERSAAGPRSHLLRRGAKVTLLDAWGPGNSRASSGGETRVIRGDLWAGPHLRPAGGPVAPALAREREALGQTPVPPHRRALDGRGEGRPLREGRAAAPPRERPGVRRAHRPPKPRSGTRRSTSSGSNGRFSRRTPAT